MNIFNLDINSVAILLGDNCNFNCKYCLQKKQYKMPTEINPEIYNFIKKVSLNQKNPIRISFYGGEPFLYFDKIKEIVNKTKYINAYYSITTNGSLFDKEKINFLNQYNFTVYISWDGKNTDKFRDFDIFKNQNIKNLIFRLKKIDISAVISAKCYPLELCQDIEELKKEYTNNNKNHKTLKVYFNEITDNGISEDFLNFNYTRLTNEVQTIINRNPNILQNIKDPNYKCSVEELFLLQYINIIESYNDCNKSSRIFAPCGDGIKMMEIDLDGNMYSCQNTRDIIGNIKNLDMIQYLVNYFKFDNTKDLYNNLCKTCDVRKICYSRCKLVSLESRVKYLCKYKKAIGKPILDFYLINNNDKKTYSM